MPRQIQLPYVLFYVKDCTFAVPSVFVREILILPPVVPIPGVSPEVRGVINLRGKITKVVDLRCRLGLESARAETDALIQLLSTREQDHRNWLAELERCVRERQAFKLGRNPHQCKFGIWYDNFKSDNSLLRMTLKKMDEPHKAIHACADRILSLAENGDFDEAMAELQARKDNELALMIKTFEEARQLLRDHQREVAIVLSHDDSRFALTIDRVEAVEHIPDANIEPMPAALPNFAGRIAKRAKTNQTVLLLEEPFLFRSKVDYSEV